MTFLPANSKTAYVPTFQTWPEDYSQLLITLTSSNTDQANAINIREIAQYDLVEILNGQQFFNPTNEQKKRFAFRKVFSFGVIAPGATLTTAHGITGFTAFTRIYATVTTDVPDYRPVPYASVTAVNQQIELKLDNLNYVIANGAAAPQINSGILVVEYLKN